MTRERLSWIQSQLEASEGAGLELPPEDSWERYCSELVDEVVRLRKQLGKFKQGRLMKLGRLSPTPRIEDEA